MIFALSAAAADILTIIAGSFTFGAELGAIVTLLTLGAVVFHTFKALETLHTVRAVTTLCQTFAALGAMALVVTGAFVAELALLAVFVAQALGAGVTLLAVIRFVTGNKAGAAFLAGRVVFQMADQAGRTVFIAGIAAAGTEAAIAEFAERCDTSAGTAVGAMVLGCAVGTPLAVGAPLLKAVVALEASHAEIAGIEQTVLTFLTVRAFVEGAFMALSAFLAVFGAFGALAALYAVIAVIELFDTAFAVRADFGRIMAVVAFFTGFTPGTAAIPAGSAEFTVGVGCFKTYI